MTFSISISKEFFKRVRLLIRYFKGSRLVLILSTAISVIAITVSYLNDWIVRYGDSESHLNIAKRVVDSITPGFAQLGGIWLPLPHLFMVPFVWSDWMWRTGLAGSIVSGIAFVVASVFLYKTGMLLLKNRYAALVMALVFMLNPNVLYMQTTPMTEVVLIAFFVLSSYYFIRFLLRPKQLASLIMASFYGFCCVLTRYEGWFLVALEATILVLYFIPWRAIWHGSEEGPGGPKTGVVANIRAFLKSDRWHRLEGMTVMFITVAFFGIILWLLWDFLILGDPLYFTSSDFSARSQQEVWQSKGQLPGYHNPWQSFLYYFVTGMSNAGVLVYFPALLGFVLYFFNKQNPHRIWISILFLAPFMFNVLTLFLGQSVIFIPHLTPFTFEHTIFNVRYGLMVIPLVAFGWAYLYKLVNIGGKLFLSALFIFQFALYGVGYSNIITWQDGMTGLSAAQRPEAERWIKDNYDHGLVLMDDYARTVSVVRSGIPMENMIYIGNKPYWEESLVTPDRHIEWIVMQENDSVWLSLWKIPARKARLTKYYEEVYKSPIAPNIQIFRKKRILPFGATDAKHMQVFWNYQCVDTMKYSRDQARDLFARQEFPEFLEREMTLIKDMGATCVSIGTPYDEEFVPYLKAWVDKAREKGLSVWFRGNMSGWEGWFGYPFFTNPEQHHAGIRNLITNHPELFEAGDIFTPAPEPENGILGDPRQSEFNRIRFTQFLPISYNNCVSAFAEIKKAVECGYFSFNGDIAKDIITKDLLVQIGDVIVIDHYVRTPERLIADIKHLHDKLDTLVMLGEFGGPIPDIHGNMDEAQQAAYMDAVMKELYKERDIVMGMNYWVLRGGSTSLVNENNSTRQAYETIRDYFLPAMIRGKVIDTLGNPVVGAKIKVPEYDTEVTTNILGEYNFVVPVGATKLELDLPGYDYDGRRELSLTNGTQVAFDFTVDPHHKNILYKFRQWLKKIF